MKKNRKVAAIHDLSGFGRASLTTIIPILSTMGTQVCPLPTAVLSTHTGGFTDFSFLDLTEYMRQHIAHWKKLDLAFDCIYSGFLGSPEQAKIVEDFIDDFGPKAELVVVDPVMGDGGELYGTMTEDMISEMKKLIAKADIITPNFTELSYLLDQPYKEEVSLEEVKEDLKSLADFGPRIVVATSVPEAGREEEITTLAYDREAEVFWRLRSKKIPAAYPGTGDAYTSVLIGNLLQGASLPVAMEKAAIFVSHCIMNSYGYNYPNREGVMLEESLDILHYPVEIKRYEKC